MRQFVPGYATIAEPLQVCKTELLRKAPNGYARKPWTKSTRIQSSVEMTRVYSALQTAFSKATMLVHHDPTRPTYVDVDA